MSGTAPELRVGCTGWGYDDWVGPFYAPGTPPSEYLRAYARVFSFAEVDSTFYAAPTPERASRWAADAPAGFLFSPKLPRAITHEARLVGARRVLDGFLDALAPLRRAGKLGPIVAQLPPSFRRGAGEPDLRAFLADWPAEHALAVELRDASWWTGATYDLLRAHDATLVWSVTETGRSPPVATSGAVYLRLVGDRALDSAGRRWARVQREQKAETAYWVERLLEAKGSLRMFVVANNHYVGYAPETAHHLAEALGRPVDLAAARGPGQRGLDAFGA